MEIYTHSGTATQEFAQALSPWIKPGMVISLEGRLGSGKTTFTQGLAKALGIKRAVKSPTYTIVKEYDIEEAGQLIHIDAYRLENIGGDSIDLGSYLREDNLVLIEWAEFIQDDLPEDYLILAFQVSEDGQRTIRLSPSRPESKYADLIEKLNQIFAGKEY